jgi:Glycine rich protein
METAMRAYDFARNVTVTAGVALLAACGASTFTTPGVATQNAPLLSGHHRFEYTGKEQSFKVPSGVTKITVVARGAAGGAAPGSSASYAGRGGRVNATIPVHPGETLYVFVGGKPDSSTGGYNGVGDGYGGGGASDIRAGGTTPHDRILVAGGGGGQGGIPGKTGKRSGHGGSGGNSTGGSGSGGDCGPSCDLSGGGGTGGSQQQGGSGGSAGGCWATCGVTGSHGSARDGGAGGDSNCGSSCNNGGNGGVGGGGYYGGGGGGGGAGYGGTGGFWPAGGGGGGGGSSYVESSATNVKMWQGWRNATGNGAVILSWQ